MILDKIWFVTSAGELKHVYCEINKKCSFWYSSSVFVAIKYMAVNEQGCLFQNCEIHESRVRTKLTTI